MHRYGRCTVTAGELREELKDASDGEEVDFKLVVEGKTSVDDREYACTVEMVGAQVKLICAEIDDRIEDLLAEAKDLKTRIATALRVLEEDAGVSESDLDRAGGHIDPVAVLARARRDGILWSVR